MLLITAEDPQALAVLFSMLVVTVTHSVSNTPYLSNIRPLTYGTLV